MKELRKAPLRVAVAASGGGRSLRNLYEQQSRYDYRVCAFISSKAGCQAEILAAEMNLPIFQENFGITAASDLATRLNRWLLEHEIDMVVLAGFLKPFPLLPSYGNKIVNIHPALLPLYGGKGMFGAHVHRAVLAAREAYSGATVHFVTQDYDEGAIIAQVKVPIGDLQDAEAIASRVFTAECRLYPQVLDGLSKGLLPLPGGKILEIEETENDSSEPSDL